MTNKPAYSPCEPALGCNEVAAKPALVARESLSEDYQQWRESLAGGPLDGRSLLKLAQKFDRVSFRIVARVSHLPHAAAFALAAGSAQGGPPQDFAFAGKGWADSTRVAASDPELWTEVFLHHPGRLDQGLSAVQGQIQALRRLIKAGKPGPLKAWLAKAAKFRQATEGKPR